MSSGCCGLTPKQIATLTPLLLPIGVIVTATSLITEIALKALSYNPPMLITGFLNCCMLAGVGTIVVLIRFLTSSRSRFLPKEPENPFCQEVDKCLGDCVKTILGVYVWVFGIRGTAASLITGIALKVFSYKAPVLITLSSNCFMLAGVCAALGLVGSLMFLENDLRKGIPADGFINKHMATVGDYLWPAGTVGMDVSLITGIALRALSYNSPVLIALASKCFMLAGACAVVGLIGSVMFASSHPPSLATLLCV